MELVKLFILGGKEPELFILTISLRSDFKRDNGNYLEEKRTYSCSQKEGHWGLDERQIATITEAQDGIFMTVGSCWL